MSRKAKKQASSMSFSLSRWFRKISTAKPSGFIISVIVIVSAVFLFSGGLYTIIEQPLPSVYLYGRFYFIHTSELNQGYSALGDQFMSETAITSMLYVIGAIGLLAIYRSTKHAYASRQAYMMLVVGVALLFLAYLFLESIINTK